MTRVPLWVIALSFPGMMLLVSGCLGQDSPTTPETPPVSEQVSEIQNALENQAQQTLETMKRDHERQQVTEALRFQQQKEIASRLPVDDE